MGIVFNFVDNLLLISSFVCSLLFMLQPRLIVYIINKDFCTFNILFTYLVSLEEPVEGVYLTDIPPKVVGVKNWLLLGLFIALVFIIFFILIHKYPKN